MSQPPPDVTGVSALGGIHHFARVVVNADGACARYEDVLGWRRIVDATLEGEDAARGGFLLGVPGAARMRMVMAQSPHAALGLLELVEIRDQNENVLAEGLEVLSFLVDDADREWDVLQQRGLTPVGPPEDHRLGGWSVRAATARTGPEELVEVMQLLDKPTKGDR